MILIRIFKYSILTTVLLAATAFAQEGSQTQEGSHSESKIALHGLDPIFLSKGKSEKGDQQFRADHDGFTYLFTSQGNRSYFEASPRQFAVQDHGNCPVAKVMMNREMKGQPGLFSVHKGQIYLFANADAKKAFEASPSKFTGSQTKKMRQREGSGY